MRERYGLRGRGESPGTAAETGVSGETDEGHVRRYFGRGKGAAATRIRKAWQEQRTGGGGG